MTIFLLGQQLPAPAARVTYDSLSQLDLALPLAELIEDLGEDLLQIETAQGDIVDVGWYPAWNLAGRLRVVTIRNGDWEAPLYTGYPPLSADGLLQSPLQCLPQLLREALAVAR